MEFIRWSHAFSRSSTGSSTGSIGPEPELGHFEMPDLTLLFHDTDEGSSASGDEDSPGVALLSS